MDPYERLQVSRFDPIDEIESTYRRLLRESHPDLHQGESREAIAEAERRTVELNEAMARIRSELRHRAPPMAHPPTFDDAEGFDSGTWGFQAGPETDWFGNPIGVKRNRAEYVDCPLCETRFTDPDLYRSHLAYEHRHVDPAADAGPHSSGGRRRSLHWMGWIPAPAFWLFVLLVIYWATVYVVLDEGLPAFIAVWLGVIAYALLLRVAYKHRHVPT